MSDVFDPCAQPGLLSYEQALQHILSQLQLVATQEKIGVEAAVGRVLAKEIQSPVLVPPHRNAAMDGFACAYASLGSKAILPIVGASLAGQPFAGQVPEGACIRITTGAKLPGDCDSVIMQEHVHISENGIQLKQAVKPGQHVRHAGEDIQLGQHILPAGVRLRPVDVGVMLSLGLTEVAVFKPLTIAVLSSGDELRRPGEVLREGDIYETNGPTLAALAREAGFEVIQLGIIADDPQQLQAAFEQADAQADVVISSGGVSVGEADHTKTVLHKLGEIAFWKVAIKPGKPLVFGQLKNAVFFGLPGNPVSALVTFQQLALPALRKMQGITQLQSPRVPAILQQPIKRRAGRMEFYRGCYSVSNSGQLEVQLTGAQGSGILTSVQQANCFILVTADTEQLSVGEQVMIQPLNWF